MKKNIYTITFKLNSGNLTEVKFPAECVNKAHEDVMNYMTAKNTEYTAADPRRIVRVIGVRSEESTKI